MNFEIGYSIDKVWFRDFGTMMEEIYEKLPTDKIPLRLVFFGCPDDNRQYLDQRNRLMLLVAQRYGEEQMPLVTYVAQKSLDSGLVVEAQTVGPLWKDRLERKQIGDTRYITVQTDGAKLLFTEGILPSSLDAPMLDQSTEVLETLERILEAEGIAIHSIVRQWNYIEQITAHSCGNQHYQDFNDARSHFYAKTDWPTGYPAATGIGTNLGGIMVEVDCLEPQGDRYGTIALDNQLQVAAHVYSQQVLIGVADKVFQQKTTPKFERAKAVVDSTTREGQVYISGTAAIRGEESLTGVGIAKQTVITLENIEYLISSSNLKKYGVEVKKAPEIKIFRVYLKSENLYAEARKILKQRYPDVPALYVLTDVCRDELLIEIEGVAQS